MAMVTAPKTLNDVLPDRWYSAFDVCHLIPSPKGGTLTTDAVNKMCRSNRISARYIPSGASRGYWAILGSEIIRYMSGGRPPVSGGTAKRVEDSMKRINATRKRPAKAKQAVR
jgi:hypothetical protein